MTDSYDHTSGDVDNIESSKIPEIEDLYYPFNVQEFVKQLYPNVLQKYFVRPVSEIMLIERKNKIEAVEIFLGKKLDDKKVDHKSIVKEDKPGKVKSQSYHSKVKFMNLFSRVMLVSIFFILFSWGVIEVWYHLNASSWAKHPIIYLIIFSLSIFLYYKLITIISPFKSLTQQVDTTQSKNEFKNKDNDLIGIVLAFLYDSTKKSKILFTGIIFFLIVLLYQYELETGFLNEFVYSNISEERIHPLISSIGSSLVFLFQLTIAALVFVPRFSKYFSDAVDLKYDRSTLRGMFAEKNLDILITPSRPHHILEVILENYPDFGAQKRSAQVGLELMEKINQSKTKDKKFRHGLNDIFSSKDIYSSICNDELNHFQWCLLGIWIFGDLTLE